MKVFKFFVCFVCVLTFTQCKKGSLSNTEDPKMVMAIETFDLQTNCSSAKVDKYIFQGKEAYVFDQGTCGADMTSNVTDKYANQIGTLGGLVGNTIINGEDFSKAVYIKTVWKK